MSGVVRKVPSANFMFLTVRLKFKKSALQDIFSWLVKMLGGVSLSVRSLASELAREIFIG
jgi:hypothetical protein